LHAVLHEIMEKFTTIFLERLNKEFTGSITEFRDFNKVMEKIIESHGLDVFNKINLTIEEFMLKNGYKSIKDMTGIAHE